jgi:hypothetical protein
VKSNSFEAMREVLLGARGASTPTPRRRELRSAETQLAANFLQREHGLAGSFFLCAPEMDQIVEVLEEFLKSAELLIGENHECRLTPVPDDLRVQLDGRARGWLRSRHRFNGAAALIPRRVQE